MPKYVLESLLLSTRFLLLARLLLSVRTCINWEIKFVGQTFCMDCTALATPSFELMTSFRMTTLQSVLSPITLDEREEESSSAFNDIILHGVCSRAVASVFDLHCSIRLLN